MAQNPKKLAEQKRDMSSSRRPERNPVTQQSLQNLDKQPKENPIILKEFKAFNEIDRQIYKHLAITLKRNVKDTVHFLPFWMWLERDVVEELNLINRMLDSTPRIVANLANKTNLCLQCVESDVFMCPGSGQKDLYYISVFSKRDITFRYLFDNRVQAVRGISKMAEEVCFRAFDDIIKVILSTSPVKPSPPFRVAPRPNLSKPATTTQIEHHMREVKSKRPKTLAHTALPFFPTMRATYFSLVKNTCSFSAKSVEVYDACINRGKMSFLGALVGMGFLPQQQRKQIPPLVVNPGSLLVTHWVPVIQLQPPVEEYRAMMQQNNRNDQELGSYFHHTIEFLSRRSQIIRKMWMNLPFSLPSLRAMMSLRLNSGTFSPGTLGGRRRTSQKCNY